MNQQISYISMLLGYRRGYHTKMIVPIEMILPRLIEIIESKRQISITLELAGELVELNSVRMLTFGLGQSCVTCGMKLEVFALQSNNGAYHLNGYGTKGNGSIVLLTSDHIIPRSRGGEQGLSNRQLMCAACNERKGDLMPGELKSPRMIKDQMKVTDERTKKYIRLGIHAYVRKWAIYLEHFQDA